MLSAKQHFQLANYVRLNQQAQRNSGRTLANPAWQMKRAEGFLTLAKMTARRMHPAHAARQPKGPPPAHGVTKALAQPQMGSRLQPGSLAPQAVRPNMPPPAIAGTPAQLGAGLLQMQGKIPGANLPGAAGVVAPNMDAVRPRLPKLPPI